MSGKRHVRDLSRKEMGSFCLGASAVVRGFRSVTPQPSWVGTRYVNSDPSENLPAIREGMNGLCYAVHAFAAMHARSNP